MEERLLPPSRRPDGTMRKPVRIRAGYVPQEEVAIYQSKGTRWKNTGPDLPPGYDPENVEKPKTKTAKRNEKRNEKRKQAKQNCSESEVDAVTGKMASLDVVDPVPLLTSQEEQAGTKTEIDKKIRALKKKIRLGKNEVQATAEKLAKVEAWENELRALETSIV